MATRVVCPKLFKSLYIGHTFENLAKAIQVLLQMNHAVL